MFVGCLDSIALSTSRHEEGLQNDKAAHLLTLVRDTRDPLECI